MPHGRAARLEAVAKPFERWELDPAIFDRLMATVVATFRKMAGIR